MSNKTKIVLSALLAFGLTSAALANEAPENKIGDRYPFLEQTVQQQSTQAYASAAVRHPVKRFTGQEKALFDRATASVSWY